MSSTQNQSQEKSSLVVRREYAEVQQFASSDNNPVRTKSEDAPTTKEAGDFPNNSVRTDSKNQQEKSVLGGENSKAHLTQRRRRRSGGTTKGHHTAKAQLNVVIETDIGHDCDDIECLQVALKDHKLGRIRICYISTVSCSNEQRAQVVQHLCACYGISDIPIFPSKREKAKAIQDGHPLDKCTRIWSYERINDRYIANETNASVHSVHGGQLCVIHSPSQSVKGKQKILRQCSDVHVLIIGPGIESETFTGLIPSHIQGAERSRAVRCLIGRIVWQGNYNDKKSFNLGCDFEAAVKMEEWATAHGIQQFNIGKLVAYNTRLTLEAFSRLAAVAHTRGFDLQAHWQLGVMEFRDANRNLFNCLNFNVSSPGQSAISASAEKFDETNPRHNALHKVLTEDSLQTSWFEALSNIPPMYDLTAYLLLRDTSQPINSPCDATVKSNVDGHSEQSTSFPIELSSHGTNDNESLRCPWFHLTQESETRFSVGATEPDIALPNSEYLALIEDELKEAMQNIIEPSLSHRVARNNVPNQCKAQSLQ